MRLPSRSLALALACIAASANSAHAHDYGHSLEADSFAARAESIEQRHKASQRVRWRDARWKHDPVVNIKLLGVNDFHGQLSPRTVGPRPAGGAAVLASYLRAAADSAKDGAIIVHAGDHVGASPPNSALLQDEPAISVMNLLANEHCREDRASGPRARYRSERCNVVGTFGNHEFDEGIAEALRLVDGGDHEDGPFLEPKWRGAKFPYVSSNVVWSETGRTVLPPYVIQKVAGNVRVGIIGAVLKETPTIVTPTGVAGLTFLDEAASINEAARHLLAQGVQTIVVTIHQGLRQTNYEGPTDPDITNLSGPIIEIVKKLDSEIDVVISGHAHGFSNALVTNDAGKQILLTQAFSASTAYGDIDLAISRRNGDVVEKSAAIVTTYGDAGPGLVPDARIAALVAAADAEVAPRVERVVGVATAAITRSESSAGESALGNLIADAQRTVTDAQFAFMNPGGIRADLDAGEVTWGDLFTIQPFANDLVSMDLTGAQVDTLLEQQWAGQSSARILKTSGLRYTWDASRPAGDRVSGIVDAANMPLDPAATYRVTVNSFIAAGGDNFFVLNEGTNRVVGPVDLEALVQYVESLPQPFSAAIEGRIVRRN